MRLTVRPPQDILAAIDAGRGLLRATQEAVLPVGEQYPPLAQALFEATAGWLMELPAGRAHHDDLGGALRHAIETGYLALRLSDATIYTADRPAEERRVLERQYRWGAFLAAVASTIPAAVSQLTVATEDGEVWSEFGRPAALHAWLGVRSSGTYVVTWRDPAIALGRPLAGMLAAQVLCDRITAGLPRSVHREIYAALAPEPVPVGPQSPMQKVVRLALAKSQELDRQRSAGSYTPGAAGQPASRERIDASVPQAPTADQVPAPAAAQPEPQDGAARQLILVPPPSVHDERTGPRSPLDALDPPVRELMESLRDDLAAGRKAAGKIKWRPTGLFIPLDVLGSYGLAQTGVTAALKRAKLIRAQDAQGLVIDALLGRMVLPEGAP